MKKIYKYYFEGKFSRNLFVPNMQKKMKKSDQIFIYKN